MTPEKINAQQIKAREAANAGLCSPAPAGSVCGRCYDDAPCQPANCQEKPEQQHGPLGMYHCPDCGAMVLAGFPHPDLCERCITRTHPEFDTPNKD